MWRLVLVYALVAFARPGMAQAPTPRPSAIVGTWRLESIVDTLPDGSLYSWLGARPTGEIRYDATGHMAVQFMRDPRPTVAAGTARQATPQELRVVYDGYYAYFGRYRLSARGDSVTHFIEASLHPEEVGSVYRRGVRVDGDRLFITSQFIDVTDHLRHRRFLQFTRVR
jgi:hypothetical protein